MSKEIKFEEALLKLEECVDRLEDGSISLDESIAAYEEAVKLVRICNERLELAESRVRILTEAKDGSVTDLPFDVSDED